MTDDKRRQTNHWPEDDELSLGDGRLDDEEDDIDVENGGDGNGRGEAIDEPMEAADGDTDQAVPAAQVAGISLFEAFGGDYQDVLLDADEAVIHSLNALTHACWYSSALIVARQPVVANQPLFDEWLQDHIGEDFDVVTIIADLLMTPDELLREVLEELDLETDSARPRESLLGALNRQDEDSERQHPRELVIQVENAHELGERALQCLLQLVSNHETMITPHIILWWADRSAKDNLDDSVEGQGVSVTRLDIPLFSRQAVLEYLQFCWGQHSDEDFPLEDDQLDDIITASGGSADALDKLVLGELRAEPAVTSAGLQLSRLLPNRLLPRAVPKRHALIGAALVLVLVLTFFLRGGTGGEETGGTSIVRVERSLPNVTGAAPATAGNNRDSEPVVSTAALQSGARSASSTAENVSSAGAVASSAGETAPSARDIATPATPATPAAPTTPAAERTALSATESAPVALAETASSSEAAPVSASTSAEPAGATASRAALEQVADERFFIQLLGSHSVETVNSFMSDNAPLDARDRGLHRFEARHEGRPWYVVIHGPYADRAAAETAMARLPETLRAASPWLRSMADIRSAIVH